MKKNTVINLGLLFVLIFNINVAAQSDSDKNDEIVINTEVAQTNFPLPTDSTKPIKVYDGETEVKDFVVTSPKEAKLAVVILFDFVKCGSRKECRELAHLGAIIRSNLNNLSNADKPLFISNSANISLKELKRDLDFSQEIFETASFNSGLEKARNIFQAKKAVRQSLLIITNRDNVLKESLLDNFESDSGYVEYIATKPDSVSKWIGWNNLNLPGLILQDNGNSGYVFDLQLTEFVNVCNRLNTVSFQRTSDERTKISIKTYSKIYGEQTKSRYFSRTDNQLKHSDVASAARRTSHHNAPLSRPALPKVDLNYYDLDVVKLEQTFADQLDRQSLLPNIRSRVVVDNRADQKVMKAMDWLKTKYYWKKYIPFVIFNYDRFYIGTQDFKGIAISTRAIELLSEDELAAVIAHELVHFILKDEAQSLALEEKCDLIGYLILPKNLKPALETALNKLAVQEDGEPNDLINQRLAALKKNSRLLQDTVDTLQTTR